MFWIIAIIVFLLIIGLMESGEKEKKVHNSSNSYAQTKSELGRSIKEGLDNFNAGLKKFNDALQIKNQANELLFDFYVKNTDVVTHFKCLVTYVDMLVRYSGNSNNKSLKSIIEENEKRLSFIADSMNSTLKERLSVNNRHEHQENNKLSFVSSIDDKNPEHYDNPAINYFNINNEALKTLLLEKTMEIIEERKSDLQDLFEEVRFGKSKAMFDGLLEYLGEKELFYTLLD